MPSIEEKIRLELSQSLGIPLGLVPPGLVSEKVQELTNPVITITGPRTVVSAQAQQISPPPYSPSFNADALFNIGDTVNYGGENRILVCWGEQKQQGLVAATFGSNFMDGRDGSSMVICKVCGTSNHEHGNYVNPGSMSLVSKAKKSSKKAVKVVKKETIPFDSVVLAPEKKEEIQAAISQIDNTELLFTDWGFSEVFEKGTAVTLLFYGIPGGGKTLMAQAIAEKLGAELKIYGMAEIGSSEPGGSERFIKKIFQEAKAFFTAKKKHQVVLFDECDALLYDRNKVGVILGAQINTLLTEIERHDGIIIFTTNRIGTLDPALERRIAAKIEFPFPTREQRVAIWKRMIPSKAPIAKDVDFEELSKYPLAGGNIKNAVLNAARMAAYKKQKTITMENFLLAIEREAQSQKAFESEHDNYHGTGDYVTSHSAMGISRKLEIDSVFNKGVKT